MKKEILFGDEKVEYLLKKNPRFRRLRLTIHQGGDFVVTAPKALSLRGIESYLKVKASWILEKLKIARTQKKPFLSGKNRKEYLELKDKARKIITEKVEFFAQRHSFHYNRISVRNQKTRWGSCSQKGNLNYHYKIALLPDDLADYIIVHELCHLRELNHGRNFWREVENILPGYKERIKKIKKHSF